MIPELLVCVSGATSGSRGLIFDTRSETLVALSLGPPILPLELDRESLSGAIKLLADSLYTQLDSRGKAIGREGASIIATSGLVSRELQAAIDQGFQDSQLASVLPGSSRWITRGRSCVEALACEGNVLVVKAGTIGFAHLFRRDGFDVVDEQRSGGWGPLTGRDGGAYFIGSRLLGRFFEELDGRSERSILSTLSNLLVGHDSVSEPELCVESLLAWLRTGRKRERLKSEVAALARTWDYLLESGADSFCTEILREAAAQLCSCAAACVRVVEARSGKLGGRPLTCLLQGHMLQESVSYRKEVTKLLASTLDSLGVRGHELVMSKRRAVVGCLSLALREVVGMPQAEVTETLDRIVASNPPLLSEDWRSNDN